MYAWMLDECLENNNLKKCFVGLHLDFDGATSTVKSPIKHWLFAVISAHCSCMHCVWGGVVISSY